MELQTDSMHTSIPMSVHKRTVFAATCTSDHSLVVSSWRIRLKSCDECRILVKSVIKAIQSIYHFITGFSTNQIRSIVVAVPQEIIIRNKTIQWPSYEIYVEWFLWHWEPDGADKIDLISNEIDL